MSDLAAFLGTSAALLFGPIGLASMLIVAISGRHRFLTAAIAGCVAGAIYHDRSLRVAEQLNIPDPSIFPKIFIMVFWLTVLASLIWGAARLLWKAT